MMQTTQYARGFSGLSTLAILVCALVGASPVCAEELTLDQVLARFDEAQQSITTLSVSFDETSVNPLLKEPVVSQGRLYLTKPDSIRWEYDSPEEMRFVIFDDIYTGYFPAQKRAEKRNIQRFSRQLFRFFGLGQTSDELEKSYSISLGDSDGRDGYMLVLKPKKRRARKRVEQVRFLLDPEKFLPVRVEYRSKDGSGREIEFTDIQINPDLAAGLYNVEIPADVEVTRGFSGLPSFDSGDTSQ